MEIKSNGGKVLFVSDSAANMRELVMNAARVKANLRGANMSRANLREANMSRADLSDADLSGANLRASDLSDADLSGANLCGADLSEAYLCEANMSRANLRGANLSEAYLRFVNLSCANMRGATIDGKKIVSLRFLLGLYKYRVWAVLFDDGSRWVRMGCLFKSLEKWSSIDIRKSNIVEFPDNGSDKSEERVAAFKFAKAAAERLK